jgi:hypothetical protein
MDELDLILLKAWDRIGAACRRNRIRALKRSRRRFKGVLTQPMREWCLVIRACDTRINDFTAIIDPPDAYERKEKHTVTLDGALIRRLTKPITIPWPGVTYREAAATCGREYQTIKNWTRQGVFSVNRYWEFRFPRDGARGGRPYLWTPSPIDPNNFTGRTPHPVWGTLWQWQWEKLPENYELVVQRRPRFRTFRGEQRFRGWDFLCPGRLGENEEYTGCRRPSTYLYAPQTVWTLAKAIHGEDGPGFDMPGDSGLAGQWFPGLADPIASTGKRSFACKQCWKVRSACMANYNGWNEFIAQISGGLLYGRDVPRPPDICPVERKKRPYRWRARTHDDAITSDRAAAADAVASACGPQTAARA